MINDFLHRMSSVFYNLPAPLSIKCFFDLVDGINMNTTLPHLTVPILSKYLHENDSRQMRMKRTENHSYKESTPGHTVNDPMSRTHCSSSRWRFVTQRDCSN